MYNTQRPQPLVVLLDKRNWSVTLPRSTVKLCLFGFVFFFFFWPCYVAFRILVPQLGIEPRPPAVKHGILTIGPPGKSLKDCALIIANAYIRLAVYQALL